MNPELFLKLYYNLDSTFSGGIDSIEGHEVFHTNPSLTDGHVVFALYPNVQIKFTALLQMGVPLMFGCGIGRPVYFGQIFADYTAPIKQFDRYLWRVVPEFLDLEGAVDMDRRYKEIAFDFLGRLLDEFSELKYLLLGLYPKLSP